jgi:16S rRNA (cytidine1402-2'-O)-methyltransferase
MGKLSIVATPIGNLQDITLRALEKLKTADLILCEDTRVTKKLLEHFGIQKPLMSYHHHSTPRAIKEIQSQLENGKHLALVTDAGTPGISDPGNELISKITHDKSLITTTKIVPIPGASAAIAALSISGFPTDKFLFLGFPPHKNKRKQFFEMVAEAEYTTVFFESGHRILKCLGELKEILAPTRQLVVCRELTKMFETTYRGTAAELVDVMKDARGEFVVVLHGKS